MRGLGEQEHDWRSERARIEPHESRSLHWVTRDDFPQPAILVPPWSKALNLAIARE
jgi:hypothetical protein